MKPVIRLSAVVAAILCCQCLPSWAQAGSPTRSTPSHASSPAKSAHTRVAPAENTVIIPGPLRSFLRMAGISQQVAVEDVLPLVARNAYATGYLNGTPTEYLRLLDRRESWVAVRSLVPPAQQLQYVLRQLAKNLAVQKAVRKESAFKFLKMGSAAQSIPS